MPLIACPDCGTQASDAAAACPKCARPIAAPAPAVSPPAKTRPLAKVGAAFIGGFVLLLVVISYNQEPTKDGRGAQDFCAGWRKSSGDLPLQRVAMRENVSRLDPGKVDLACLERREEELVRWANRTCGGGAMRADVFAFEFSREARRLCP